MEIALKRLRQRFKTFLKRLIKRKKIKNEKKYNNEIQNENKL